MADVTALNKNLTLRTLYDSNAAFDISQHAVLDANQWPDALRCRAFDQICDILDYDQTNITQATEGAFDLLAKRYYGDERLYWVLMVFNGISNYRNLTPGTLIRIPEGSQVKQILTTLTAELRSMYSGQQRALKSFRYKP